LSPEAHYYQRLLASDQAEAKQVLEDYLKTNSLEDLYDSVVIPALALAEQDRHHDDLEEITEQFICKSTKEILDELGDRSKEPAEVEEQKAKSDLAELSAPKIREEHPRHVTSVVCIPARDEADEIVGIMLTQLLERAGYQAQAISIGTTAEMLAQTKEAAPEIVCISALPPFALLHARDLYKRVRSNVPNAKITVGLWKFPAIPSKRPPGLTSPATISWPSHWLRPFCKSVFSSKLTWFLSTLAPVLPSQSDSHNLRPRGWPSWAF
jgi:hypothetical protein